MSFVEDRHKAFAAVLNSNDTKELRKYCKKYGMSIPKDRKVMIVGVLKAIRYCTDFSEEEKDKAFMKCLNMGFSPLVNEWEDDCK